MKKNILLISMSTLKRPLADSFYIATSEYSDKEYLFVGQSQLEPGTKFIIERLNQKNEKLDKIIILATEETLKNVEIYKGEEYSAVTYYIEKIKRYIASNDSEYYSFDKLYKKYTNINVDKIIELIGEDCKVPNNEKLEEVKKAYTEIYKSNNVDEKIIVQCVKECLYVVYYNQLSKTGKLRNASNSHTKKYKNVDELFEVIEIPSPEKTKFRYEIPRLIDVIQSQFENPDDSMNIFQDVQGGARTAMFLVNAALNMLKNKTIILKNAYAISYSQDNCINYIKDESITNNVLELVSGMSEFLNYGRAKKFRAYITSGDTSVRKAETDLIKKIQKISDAISFCNINGFYESLDELNQEIINYKNTDQKKDPLIESFIGKLEESYGDILRSDRKATDVIRWCMDKEWYQQALTVCESKLPEQLVKEGIVFYCNSLQNKPAVITELGNRKVILNNKRQGYMMNDVNLYAVKYYARDMYNNDTALKYDMAGKIIKLITDGEFYTLYSNRSKIKNVLTAYFDIANIRNEVNHGKSDDSTMNRATTGLKNVLKQYKELVESENVIVGNRVVMIGSAEVTASQSTASQNTAP